MVLGFNALVGSGRIRIGLILLILLLLAFLDVFRYGVEVSGGNVDVVPPDIDGRAASPYGSSGVFAEFSAVVRQQEGLP